MSPSAAFLAPNRFQAPVSGGIISGIVPPHALDAYADHAIQTGNVALQDSLSKTLAGMTDAYQRNQASPVIDLIVSGRRGKKAKKPAEPQVDLGAYEKGKKEGVSEIFIYTANYKMTQPGTIVWRDWEPDPVEDKVEGVKALIGYMRSDIEFLKANNVKGIHEGNTEFHATVFYDDMDNAYWDGTQMVFGGSSQKNGGTTFRPFHLGDGDVLTHEVEHAITESEAGADMKGKAGFQKVRTTITDARTGQKRRVTQYKDVTSGKVFGGLNYRNESGAWNESYSDVASLFRRCRETGKTIRELGYDDLLLGAGCMIGNNDRKGSPVFGKKSAIRNFDNAPGYDRADIGTDPQPKFYSKRYKGGGDNGGVHYNSGITNYALVLAGRYLAETNANEKFTDALEAVWFKARRRMHADETFKEGALELVAAAKELFPNRPEVAQAVEKAFTTVEVLGQRAGGDQEGREGGERGDLSMIAHLSNNSQSSPAARPLTRDEIAAVARGDFAGTDNDDIAVTRKGGAADSDAGRGDEGKNG